LRRTRASRPQRVHYMIRNQLYFGLRKGAMNLRGFFEDEKFKLKVPARCWYCGGGKRLAADHIVPRAKGGADGGENLVYACRHCNSSKGSRDLSEWMAKRGRFPPLYLLLRYLKMAILHCRAKNLMDVPVSEAGPLKDSLPFALDLIPHKFPPADELRKWVAVDHRGDTDASDMLRRSLCEQASGAPA
jgi:hypothetical protein